MPTQAQACFSEGFAALASVHGETWTFGEAAFPAVSSALIPTDPRMQGSPDRLIEVTVETAALPESRPGRGDDLVCNGNYHRIVRADHESTGLSIFLVTST